MENRDENTKKLFVGNLNYSVTDWEQFKSDMSQIGKVLRANIIVDKDTKKSRGFAFLIVPASEEQKFLDANGSDYEGRPLVIKPAVEKEDRKPRPQGDRGPAQDNRDRRPPREIKRNETRSETDAKAQR